jgi:hypothetical protein
MEYFIYSKRKPHMGMFVAFLVLLKLFGIQL